MIELHYGVVRIEGQWAVIADGLRLGRYSDRMLAERLARRMADQAAGLPVTLHLQGECGELRREVHRPNG